MSISQLATHKTQKCVLICYPFSTLVCRVIFKILFWNTNTDRREEITLESECAQGIRIEKEHVFPKYHFCMPSTFHQARWLEIECFFSHAVNLIRNIKIHSVPETSHKDFNFMIREIWTWSSYFPCTGVRSKRKRAKNMREEKDITDIGWVRFCVITSAQGSHWHTCCLWHLCIARLDSKVEREENTEKWKSGWSLFLPTLFDRMSERATFALKHINYCYDGLLSTAARWMAHINDYFFFSLHSQQLSN